VAAWQAPCSNGAVHEAAVSDSEQREQNEVTRALAQWNLDLPTVRTLLYRAPTPRERERWHALWLLARGWTAAEVAVALERDPHTIGEWRAGFCRAGPAAITFEQSGGSPPP
jgi:anti-sigma-K factor RskA